MGVFGWILRKFDEAVVGKEHVDAQRGLFQEFVDQVEQQQDVHLLDSLLTNLASKETSAEATLLMLFLHFAPEQYGGRISALVQSLPSAEGAEWRATLLAISKLRAELAAICVDAILTPAIEQRTNQGEAAILTKTRELLVAEYRKGEPLRFVRKALDRG